VGQVLKIPYPTPNPAQSSAYSSAELSAFPKYIVQPDDTLEKIAESYNVSAEEIRQANDMPDNTVVTDSALIIPITRLEGERGIVQFQIYEKPDGRRRTSYTFFSERDQTSWVNLRRCRNSQLSHQNLGDSA
jgi:LysM repeat protein